MSLAKPGEIQKDKYNLHLGEVVRELPTMSELRTFGV